MLFAHIFGAILVMTVLVSLSLLTQGKKIKKSSCQPCFSIVFLDIIAAYAFIGITHFYLWI